MAVSKVYPVKDVHITNHSYSGYYLFQSGASAGVWLGAWDWPEYSNYANFYAYQSRGLFKFDLPDVPDDTTVISAKLKARMSSGRGLKNERNKGMDKFKQTPTIDVHEVLQEWDEGKGLGNANGFQGTGATWTLRKANGYGWNRSGGYYDTKAVSSQSQLYYKLNWEFDVTSLVQKWKDNPDSNNGLLMKFRDDHVAEGSFSILGKDYSSSDIYLEITYNSPPEKPRGLSPNFGSFICQDLSHSMHFKWTFLDLAGSPAKGKTDVAFLIDRTSSMLWRTSWLKDQVTRYVDRMTDEQVDYQIHLVAYGDVRYNEPTVKYGPFATLASALSAIDSMPRYDGGDYPDTGLEAIMDHVKGVASLPWRENSYRQLMICTDAPMHNRSGVDTYYKNASEYELTDVTTWLKNNRIITSVATNTHCSSYTQLRLFPNNTNGQYLEETSRWGDYFNIRTIRTLNEETAYDEGDYQTKAVIRIWQVKPNGTTPLIFTHTVNGSASDVSLKGLGVPWEEGATYEWDVTVYDKYNVVSPPSDKARFTYIIDVNAAIGIPMFNETLAVGQPVTKGVFDEIKDKLYYEVRKYRNLDPGKVLTLFETELVPLKSDINRVKEMIDGILVNDGLLASKEDLIEESLGVSDIAYIRDRIVSAAMSNPDKPSGGRATRSIGMIHRPISIYAKNNHALDKTIEVSWSPAYFVGDGWQVKLAPAKDTDINYYKFYHEEVLKLSNATKKILTEVYMKADQITDGTVYVPITGRIDAQSMWYHAHDMNGRASIGASNVVINANASIGTAPTTVSRYQVQRQQKHWSATIPDPNGTWATVYTGSATNFKNTVTAEGSYWYRVRATDNLGKITDWTYSESIVYVKY